MSIKTYKGNGLEGSVAIRHHGQDLESHLKVTKAQTGVIQYSDFLDLVYLECRGIGGDHIMDHNGNINISSLVVRDNEVWFDYDDLHQDVYQAYSLYADGKTIDTTRTIRNVFIANVDIEISGDTSQVFMLSEACGYDNFHIGYENLRIRCDYDYWFVANTLTNSIIGNQIPGGVDIQKWDGTTPKVRIGDGLEPSKYKIKASKYRTFNVELFNCGFDNPVPDSVKQF